MSSTLMISVSGMRGIVGTDLTPELVARHAAALGAWARGAGKPVVVLGRDARTSGEMFARASLAGLQSVGCEVIDCGLVPTPTVQLAVEHHHAGAGLVLTASHNPVEWNALKMVGPDGIFLDADTGAQVRGLAEQGPARAGWDTIGAVRTDDQAVARHIEAVLALPEVDLPAIRRRKFRVALDCVRGAGGVIMPQLLERLGCTVSVINLATDGRFPRPPEPLPEHMGALTSLVRASGADLGVAVDPDVDRIAVVDERGEPIGEDYTLAFAVRAVLARGVALGEADAPVVVANLSTSLVVEDAAHDGGARFLRAPVGEAHVARMIRDEGALIGGEGNGGVMLPSLHLGRDAPLGMALILQYLAGSERPVSELVAAVPRYQIVKAKLARGADLGEACGVLRSRFPEARADERDGLRLAWDGRWLHLRASGTEPVIRIIAEARKAAEAEAMITACRNLLS
jgi:phosphomannomutase